MSDRAWPPTPGYYTYRKLLKRLPNGRWRKGPIEPCRIWFGPPLDPETGEELDRSHQWNCMISGVEHDINEIWPYVAADKIEAQEYTRLLEEMLDE